MKRSNDLMSMLTWDEVFPSTMRSMIQQYGSFNFPNHNIRVLNDDIWVDLAVAGYDKEQLSIEIQDDLLIVKGDKKEESDEYKYITKQITSKSFCQKFSMHDNVEFIDATYKSGILSIQLRRIVPEKPEPLKIEIKDLD